MYSHCTLNPMKQLMLHLLTEHSRRLQRVVRLRRSVGRDASKRPHIRTIEKHPCRSIKASLHQSHCTTLLDLQSVIMHTDRLIVMM